MISNIHPLTSILCSILIINGFYNLSKFISKTKYLIFLEDYPVRGRLISFFLTVNIFSIFLYNFFLFFGVNELYLKILVILLILIGFYRPDNIQKLFKKFTDLTQGVRRSGAASIDLCYLAAGKVDGYWEYDLSPWDTAAGIVIAEEAGAKITNLNGDGFSINDDNLLASNGLIHYEMIRVLKNSVT